MSFSSLGGTLARLQLAVDEFFDGYFAGAPNFLVANNYVFLLTISHKENFNFRQYQVQVGYRHFSTEMSFLRNIFVTLFFNAMLLLSCYVLWCKIKSGMGGEG